VRVLREGSASDVVEFRPRWFGAGDIATPNGDVLRWQRGDFWGRRWQMIDSGGLARLTFARTPSFLSLDTRVEPAEHAWDDALEPLVFLGYFLLLLMARQAHAH
jgi:hypothetical protein